MSDPRHPRPRRPLVLVATLVLVVALLGACGGGGSDDDTGATAPPTGGTVVKVKDFVFNPKTITVASGETVTWDFEDSTVHNVVADGFRSATLGKGKTFSHTFDEAGTFDYVCSLHAGMKGTVEVG